MANLLIKLFFSTSQNGERIIFMASCNGYFWMLCLEAKLDAITSGCYDL